MKNVKIECLNVRFGINIKNGQKLFDIKIKIDWPNYEPDYKQFFADIYSVIYCKKNLIVTALNKLRE